MNRYPVMVERDDGWCDWVNPAAGKHRMACCDCSLVHNMEFRVVVRHSHKEGGWYEVIPVEGEQFAVQFRAQRNNRATAGKRRATKGAMK